MRSRPPSKPAPSSRVTATGPGASKCCAASISSWRPALPSPCSVPRVPARARFFIFWAASTGPTGGGVAVEGRDLARLGARERLHFRNRRLGFVYQFHHLIAELSAGDNVALPLVLGGRSWRSARGEAAALLGRVGLGARLHNRPSTLSGGERQRVAVARALVARPALVLADEPTGNLDPATGGEVVQLLCELPRAEGAALVVATHDAHLARVLDRRLVLREGRLTEEGDAAASPL